MREAEWAAERVLADRQSPWDLLTAAFANLGAWPSPEILSTPGIGWF